MTIGAAEKIVIGNDVFCGANVIITDFDWHSVDPSKRQISGTYESAPVTIEDNVWIGLNAIILKGVTICKNSVVGARSIVTKSIPEMSLRLVTQQELLRTIFYHKICCYVGK